MPDSSANSSERLRKDGKFFRLGSRKFHVKGVSYGPFAPNSNGEMFASPEPTARDFKLIKELNANVVRVYHVPPLWFLDLAAEHSLKVFVDIPWPRHLCFLDSERSQREARDAVRDAVKSCREHPAVFAYSVANEISAEIARWSGTRRVERFIDELISEAKTIDSECLCTFASFPPTEFLRAASADFVCFNLYLHQPKAFEDYLARLQTLADAKPLVLGEFGMDSIREGETRKSNFLKWQIELACRAGLAGTVAFSFTDDWFRGGVNIEDWSFGLTTRDRRTKDSFYSVQKQYRVAPYFPLSREEKVSVVVATYNGGRTLEGCLESLTNLNYPDYEVIVVDDGSTDGTSQIVRRFPSIRHIRQENRGLSTARNTGIRAATGSIVAFTDSDCRADEDWLYYLVSDLQRGGFAGIGGHNFLPPEDSCVAAAVLVSPGGPAHVLLTDREAEHIPGCNMMFYKWALEEIGLFDPIFTKAGDDVDVCWRIQDCNLKIGFSPAGFVWHHRRSTVKAYLKQQAGYGEAEALLMGKHPEHFNLFGGGIWRGRIYAPSHSGLLLRSAVIYHGVFGSGFFQRLYAPDPVRPLLLWTSIAYHACVNLPLLVLAFHFRAFVPLAIASVGISLIPCVVAAIQAQLPREKRRFWSRPLIALLFFLQPIVRGWARFEWRQNLRSIRSRVSLEQPAVRLWDEVPETAVFWSSGATTRYRFLSEILARLEQAGWNFKTDTGWRSYDLEIPASVWTRLRLTTVTEELEQGKMNFRCRIQGLWSLPGHFVFLALGAVAVLLIYSLAGEIPWIWMILPAMWLVFWFFEDEKEENKRALSGIIHAAAREQSLVKVE